ncbi:MAG TPA: hypothetical protein VFV49_15405 [Thermoanaerobaculia bacterium]|nr:hypothetical protein [Thermoanaerobaculia bacterium]
MKTTKSLAAASLALILLAACGSSGMGDILGGGSSNQGNYEIRGTVESVDVNSRSIFLSNVTGYNASMLSNGGSGSTVRVYYDDRTPVEFNGQSYRPSDLERGDQVAVRVDESGNNLLAESMTVIRDVSSGSSSYPTYPSGSYESNIRGTVRYVDTSRRTIEVDRGSGSTTFVEFESNTPVRFNNQTYNPVDLERGDEIDIRARDLGNGRFLATDISVIRSVSSNGTYGNSSTQTATIRGTVRYIDTSRRTIELESASWISGFNSGAGTSTRTIINYDTNASIYVNGRNESVSGLERGDVIEVQVSRDGSTLWARQMSLIRDANSY